MVWIRDTVTGVHDDFIFGPGIDEPLVRKSTNGAKSYYVVDGLGSVVALVNDAGAVTESRIYDAWGGTASPPTFGYTGRELGSGVLLYYRARYYDPNVGRFISEDPLAFVSAQNQYIYAENSPTQWIDPFGRQSTAKIGDPFKDFELQEKCIKDAKDSQQRKIKTAPAWYATCMDMCVNDCCAPST